MSKAAETIVKGEIKQKKTANKKKNNKNGKHIINKHDRKAIEYLNKQKDKKKLKLCIECENNQEGYCLKEKLFCTQARKYCDVIKEVDENAPTLGQYWKEKSRKEREKKKSLLNKNQ